MRRSFPTFFLYFYIIFLDLFEAVEHFARGIDYVPNSEKIDIARLFVKAAVKARILRYNFRKNLRCFSVPKI